MNKEKFKITKLDATKVLLAIIFISLVFIPLFHVFSFLDMESVQKVIQTSIFPTAVKNSLLTTTVATVITVVLAYTLAMCIERTKIRWKGIFSIIFVLPMLVPSISNGMGLVILFGNNGIITNWLKWDGNIYGFWGIVIGSVLYAFPVAFLMFTDVIKYEDGSPYEAADVLGIPKIRQFGIITFPYLRKPLITTVFAVFTLIVTDYGVPLMVGGKCSTIPLVMYQEVIGQLDFSKGAVYGSLLLIPAVIAFIIDLLNRDNGKSGFVTKKCALSKSRIVNAFAYVMSIACCIFTLLPIASFVVLAFSKNYPKDMTFTLDNIEKILRLRADEYFVNSILIALCTAVIGTIIAFLTAYLSARVKTNASKFLHLSSMTSAAIPGIVLGLSYVLAFQKTSIYGTIIILIFVNIIHFISSPYLMIYNSLSKINENIEAVALTLGINRVHTIKDIFIPMCKQTFFEMFSYFFVNCMITISAVSFLANTKNKPVSLMINQFEAQSQLEYAAVVSLAILCMNLIVKGIFHILKKRQEV